MALVVEVKEGSGGVRGAAVKDVIPQCMYQGGNVEIHVYTGYKLGLTTP